MENFYEKLKKAHNLFLDLLFPITCRGCQKNDTWLCNECLAKIIRLESQTCPLCEKNITPDGKTCFSCKNNCALDGLLVCTSYQEKIIRILIHDFKYRFIENLAVPLGKIMVEKITTSSLPLPNFLIPVPLHPRRLRWRGFNQSLLLAQEISPSIAPGIEIPILKNTLVRIRNTQAQMKIKNHPDRLNNIQQAFSIQDSAIIQGKTVLLIDDIATTGATLFQCAEILKKNGVRQVYALVIARQEIKTN